MQIEIAESQLDASAARSHQKGPMVLSTRVAHSCPASLPRINLYRTTRSVPTLALARWHWHFYTTSSAVSHSVLYLSRDGGEGSLCPRDLGQDPKRGGPDERLGIDVVMGNVQIDGPFQFGHAGEAIVPDELAGDVVEEALDFEPRGAGRGEVHDEARATRRRSWPAATAMSFCKP